MKITDFSYFLTSFLNKYLPGECGYSNNTISSYKYAFILLLKYFKNIEKISVEKLSLKKITKTNITAYLKWLETERNCSVQTRNVRLAAIHSFFKYIQYESPENLFKCQEILSIPMKRYESRSLSYMSLKGIKKLLELPNIKTRSGRRDLALLSLLYDTAARVQELIDLTPISVGLEKPYTIQLKGKGNNVRIVPLMEPEIMILKNYMNEWNLNKIEYNNNPLFFNTRRKKLTRSGVSYILNKYITKLREQSPIIVPEKFSCHCLRHSKSMHMLQAGVNLIYIRDILGHKSVKTTEIYARADSKQKREAIEKAYTNLIPKIEKSKWDENNDLLEWLNNFDK